MATWTAFISWSDIFFAVLTGDICNHQFDSVVILTLHYLLIHLGLSNGDMTMNSQLPWLHGGMGDQGIQSLNFQGFGVTPFMQPRFDASMLGLQPDILQAMAALDSSKLANQPLMQFQHIPSTSASSIQSQLLHPSNLQHTFLQGLPENQLISQAQMLQQQLQCHQSYNTQQQQLQRQQLYHDQQLQEPHQVQRQDQQQTKAQLCSATQSQLSHLQVLGSTGSQQTFSDLVGHHINTSNNSSTMQSLLSSFSRNGASTSLNMPETNSLVSPSSSSKRIALESQIPSQAPYMVTQAEVLTVPNTKVSDFSTLFSPNPGRQVLDYQAVAVSQNNALFGVNGMSNLKGNSPENGSLPVPYATSTFTSTVGGEYPVNSDMTTSSCVDESGVLQSSENVDQANSLTETFVKVSVNLPEKIWDLLLLMILWHIFLY